MFIKTSSGSNCSMVRKKRKFLYLVSVIPAYSLLATGPALAAPQGGVVTTGIANISRYGAVTNVNQSTKKASINWQSFSTKPTETVNFNQPSASAITLNRVIGNEKSVLEGALNATGKVFLINSNGVMFTKGSFVNTAGFVASTLNITDEDFNAGKYVFKGNGSTGPVINLGAITAIDGGYVALLGNAVSNHGVISVTRGTIAMAGGNKITLNFNGDSLVSVSIDEGTLNALVENKEAIYADGGTVILTARAADNLLSAQVNNNGLIQARTINDLTGNINIHAYGGTANVDGTLDASAPTSGAGGSIETSGNKINIAGGAFVITKSASGRTGTWLIDPDGFTIGAGGDITGNLLGSLLGDNNITLSSTRGGGSDGNINVNEAVSWSANTVLTLNATNDINVNKSITATGKNAGLALNYGGDYHILTRASYSGVVLDANGNPAANLAPTGTEYASIALSGSNAGLKINGISYKLLHSMKDLTALDDVTGTTSGHFALAGDLNASGTTYSGAPIAVFSGTLAGLGHTISNLSVSGSDDVGLIGQTVSGTKTFIRDIGLEGVKIHATGSNVGTLLGHSYGDLIISRAYSTGTVAGSDLVGGLIGNIDPDTAWSRITDSFSGASVRASEGCAGGLIEAARLTAVTNSHSTGDVTGAAGAAGLIFDATATNVAKCYATGDVSASGSALSGGGLIGIWTTDPKYDNSILNSFATGNVTGGYALGGLVGVIQGSGKVTVASSFATGTVKSEAEYGSASDGVGGLFGFVQESGTVTVSNSHATGDVIINGSNVLNVGGLIGSVGGLTDSGSTNITDSYATGDIAASGGTYVGGLIGWVNDGATISGCQATGDVTGASVASPGGTYEAATGGLVGYMFQGKITDSYASGTVTGHSAGGLAGGIANMPVKNSYWNADSNHSGFGTSAEVTITESQGLTSAQFKDIRYYLNGTINDVLAARQAAATAQAAYRAAAGRQEGSNAGQALQNQAGRSIFAARNIEQQQTSINDQIVYAGSADYSADIKSIDADGIQFELYDESHGGKK